MLRAVHWRNALVTVAFGALLGACAPGAPEVWVENKCEVVFIGEIDDNDPSFERSPPGTPEFRLEPGERARVVAPSFDWEYVVIAAKHGVKAQWYLVEDLEPRIDVDSGATVYEFVIQGNLCPLR